MTRVRCLVVDQEISARECVDQQVTERCWCSKAPLAVVEVSAVAVNGSRLAEQISTCKNTAQAMLRKPADQRYDGPALRKVKGLPEPGEVPLPSRVEKSLAEIYREANKPTDKKPAAFMVQGEMDAPARRVVPEADLDDMREDAIAAQEKLSSMKGKSPSPDEVAEAVLATRAQTALDNGTCLRPGCGKKTSSKDGHCATCREAVLRAASGLPAEKVCEKHGCNRSTRSKTGYCTACQHAHEDDKAATATKRRGCSTPGCVVVMRRTDVEKCRKCSNGVRPGSGLDPCATPGCPKKVQRFRGEEKCTLCRRGLKLHLRPSNEGKKPDEPAKPAAKEPVMARVFCACKREIRRIGGKLHDKCRRCRIKAGEVERRKDRPPKKRPPLSEIKPVEVRAKVVGGFDPGKLTIEQLTWCAEELWRRIRERDSAIDAAQRVLAGEPPRAKTG